MLKSNARQVTLFYKNTIIANTIPTFKMKKEISNSTLGLITGIRQI